MSFIPEQHKEAIKTSNGAYLSVSKIESGKSLRLRIMSPKPHMGWEAWQETEAGQKPVRWAEKPDSKALTGCRKDSKGNYELKLYLTVVVWNYAESKFQILSITQKGIMQALDDYSSDPDYGSPTDWDFEISKEGSGQSTKYKFLAKPPKPVSPDIAKAFSAEETSPAFWDLDALWDGEHPYEQLSSEPYGAPF